MTRAAFWLLGAGVLLFVGLLAWQGIGAVFATLALVGWGMLLVALFHLLPLVLDALAIRVLFDRATPAGAWRQTVIARWVGESANSLMPAGQIGGPVLMARHLSRRGMPIASAAAAVTVSTTLQAVAQIVFALVGVLVMAAQARGGSQHTLLESSLFASAFLAVQVGGFYLIQRRGVFARVLRVTRRISGRRDWSQWMDQATAIDRSLQSTYARSGAVTASFALSLVGWLVGTGEVYWVLQLLDHPVTWAAALVLESLGQAIRGAAFAIPGALGVQEGGYLLLAPLVGLTPEIALALSLAKRAREILLGLPGVAYLHRSMRGQSHFCNIPGP